MAGGNPAVVLDDDAIAKDPGIIVINLPDRSNFEEIRPVWAPNLEKTPLGGSLRLKVDISNDANSGCDAILGTATFTKVLGKKQISVLQQILLQEFNSFFNENQSSL